MGKTLMIQREPYFKLDRQYWSYYVKGTIRGKECRVNLIPPDVGGYDLLDIVFDDADSCVLTAVPFSIKDESGATITGNTFMAVSTDPETGEVYECKVKPALASGKTMLSLMLR